MAKRILLIEKEHEAQNLQAVKLLPLKIQKQLATYDLSLYEFIEILNSDSEVRGQIANGEFFVVSFEDMYYNIPLAGQEVLEIESDNLFVSILRQDEGYNVNVSSVPEMARARDMNEEHDPLYTAYFSDEELK